MLSAAPLRRVLTKYNAEFAGAQMADSGELLDCLLTRVHADHVRLLLLLVSVARVLLSGLVW